MRQAARLADRGILELAGADAQRFLQGLVTADVDRLAPERAIWAALLSPQGRYLADFALALVDERILLDVERERLADLARGLGLYRLRAAVSIEDRSAAWAVFAVPGADGAAGRGLPAEPGACRRIGAALAFVDPRLVRILAPASEAEAVLAALDLEPGPAAVWERHRLRLGVPDGARDLVVDKALAVEAGFLELGIVSLTKGCFVGQEVTARMAHRGLVRRRLLPVRLDGPLPPPGTPVLRAGREVGELRSGFEDRALALLRLEALDPGPPLEALGVRLTPEIPVWAVIETKSLT